MATIVTRAGKGSPLTNNEVDQNFINLNTDKLEGTVAIANGGTGQTTKIAAFDALSPASTKGDLIAFDGTDNVRLGVGTNDFVLTADSTAATGLAWKAAAGGVTTFSTGTTGLTPSTATTGAVTLGGTLAIANGGTGAITNTAARTNLGATTVGSNLFTLTNPSAIRFLRVNADNSVSSLDASTFRTAIGAGTGTVFSVSGTGSASGISLSGTVTGSGSLTLSGSIDGQSISNLQLFNTWLAGAYERVYNLSSWSGAVPVILNQYNWFRVQCIGNISFSISGGASSQGSQGQDIWMLEIINGGAYTVTWPTGVKWPNGTPPALSATGTDLIAFTKYNGSGGEWQGFLVGKDIK